MATLSERLEQKKRDQTGATSAGPLSRRLEGASGQEEPSAPSPSSSGGPLSRRLEEPQVESPAEPSAPTSSEFSFESTARGSLLSDLDQQEREREQAELDQITPVVPLSREGTRTLSQKLAEKNEYGQPLDSDPLQDIEEDEDRPKPPHRRFEGLGLDPAAERARREAPFAARGQEPSPYSDEEMQGFLSSGTRLAAAEWVGAAKSALDASYRNPGLTSLGASLIDQMFPGPDEAPPEATQWATEVSETLRRDAERFMPDDTTGRIGAQVVGILGQLPMYGLGGSVGRMATQGLLARIAEKSGSPVLTSLFRSGVTGATTFGGAKLLQGDAGAEEVVKEGAFGGVVGPVGQAARLTPSAAELFRGVPYVGRGAAIAWPKPVQDFGIELAGFLGAEKLIHGSKITKESAIDTFGTLLGLMIVNRTTGRFSEFAQDIRKSAEINQARGKLTPEQALQIMDTAKRHDVFEIWGKAFNRTERSEFYQEMKRMAEEARKEANTKAPRPPSFEDHLISPEGREAVTPQQRIGTNKFKGAIKKVQDALETRREFIKRYDENAKQKLNEKYAEAARFNGFTRNVMTLRQMDQTWGDQIPYMRNMVNTLWGRAQTDAKGRVIGSDGMWPTQEKLMENYVIRFNERLEKELSINQQETLARVLIENEKRVQEGRNPIGSRGVEANHGRAVARGFRLYQGYSRSFLNLVERTLTEDVQRKFEAGADPAGKRVAQEEANAQIKQIREQIADLKRTGFYPRMRFGDKRLRMKAFTKEGERDPANDVLVSYDAKIGRNKAKFDNLVKKLKKQYSAELKRGELTAPQPDNQAGKDMADYAKAVMASPLELANRVRTIMEEAGSVDKARAEFEHVMREFSGGKGEGGTLGKLKGNRYAPIEGVSQELIRVNSAYFSNAIRALMRVKYGHELLQNTANFRAWRKRQLDAAANQGRSVDDKALEKMEHHLKEMTSYIMFPPNELPSLRQAVFASYFMFKPAAAVLNASQVGLATYPELAAAFGDRAALSELTKATKQVFRHPRNKDAVKSSTDAETKRLMQYLFDAGIVDQSYMQMAAAAAEGKAGEIVAMQGSKSRAAVEKAINAGIMPFKWSEQANRRITGLAAFRLARKNGMSEKEAVEYAGEVIHRTQFDYTRPNRPRMMGGNTMLGKFGPSTFLFKVFMQNMLWRSLPVKPGKQGVDPSGLRTLGMLFAAAGIQGIPGAEVLENIASGLMSEKGEFRSAREDLEDFLEEAGEDPDLLMNGLAHNFFGAAPLARSLGISMPDIDFSQSLSMGDVGLGTGPMSQMAGQSIMAGKMGDTLSGQEIAGHTARGLTDLAGPVAQPFTDVWDYVVSDDPNSLMKFANAQPMTAVSNFVRAYNLQSEDIPFIEEWAAAPEERGKVLARSGELIAEFNEEERLGAAVARLVGFPATRTRRGWENYIDAIQAKQYWSSRRAHIMLDYWTNFKRGMDQGIPFKKILDETNLNQRLQEYRDTAPYPEMVPTAEDIKRSLKSRYAELIKTRKGLPSTGPYGRLERDFRDEPLDSDVRSAEPSGMEGREKGPLSKRIEPEPSGQRPSR